MNKLSHFILESLGKSEMIPLSKVKKMLNGAKQERDNEYQKLVDHIKKYYIGKGENPNKVENYTSIYISKYNAEFPNYMDVMNKYNDKISEITKLYNDAEIEYNKKFFDVKGEITEFVKSFNKISKDEPITRPLRNNFTEKPKVENYYICTKTDWQHILPNGLEQFTDEYFNEKKSKGESLLYFWQEYYDMCGRFWDDLKKRGTFVQSPKSDSMYVTMANGDIYRYSNHWGRVASCQWNLSTSSYKKDPINGTRVDSKFYDNHKFLIDKVNREFAFQNIKNFENGIKDSSFFELNPDFFNNNKLGLFLVDEIKKFEKINSDSNLKFKTKTMEKKFQLFLEGVNKLDSIIKAIHKQYKNNNDFVKIYELRQNMLVTIVAINKI